jgi:hypothetical protein
LFRARVDVDDDAMIREATSKGLTVAGERYGQEIEYLCGR